MAQDIIIKGRDNQMVVNFTFDVPEIADFNLSNLTDLELTFGSESYKLTTDPAVVYLISENSLGINLSGTSETSAHYLDIVAHHDRFPQGFQLTNRHMSNLTIPKLYS